MKTLVLDTEFNALAVVDFYESMIWTDRYSKAGDFEIYTPVTTEIKRYLQLDNYLWTDQSEHLMIIEFVETIADFEDGDKLLVKGRSLESILDRRIIWNQTIIRGNLQLGIKTLIGNAIIAPTIEARRIENFIFEDSTDEAITSLTLDSAQFTGDNLLEVVEKLCESAKIGFKITLNENYQIVFKLYAGKDRSYDQTENPFVVFSPKFENIINSNYLEDKTNYKTVTLIAGEGEGASRKTATYAITADTGINRREIYTDARDISSDTEGGELSPAQYVAQLVQRGKETIKEAKIEKIFDGEVEATKMFKFNEDFYLGDIVQIENHYDLASRARVTEMIISQDTGGFSAYPSFEIIEEEQS